MVASSGTSLTTGQLKLIGHLTRNLTILYDGDAAGIKAALRGLDMALEENFIVKLVLLPEGEDPDSYVQQNGSSAFEQYVQEHKKDVIDFMMDLGLKEARNDPFKKSALVNEIAESISKIDRTKNPTLQLHYIKEASQRLQLEEDAFVGIVNNFIREKVKQQQKGEATRPATPREYEEQPDVLSSSESESLNLFQKDYKEEWQLIKMLIEYGFRPYEESPSVADYFFENIDITSFENALAHDIAMAYYQYWSDKQEHPPLQFFVNHPMKSIKEKVVDLVHVEHLPSENWEKKYNIELPRTEDLYESDVRSSFAYFKLKLLKRFLQENLDQLKSCADPAEAEKLVRTNILLKQQEKELMNIVIVR
ncbi:DNA primase [compost metagenome]